MCPKPMAHIMRTNVYYSGRLNDATREREIERDGERKKRVNL